MPARHPDPNSPEDDPPLPGHHAPSGWRWLKWLIGAAMAGVLALLLWPWALRTPWSPSPTCPTSARWPTTGPSCRCACSARMANDRRIRRGTPQSDADRGHPAAHDQCRAGDRGRAVLRAQWRRLHRAAAGRDRQPGPGQEPGCLDDHDAGRAQRLSRARRATCARSTRSCDDGSKPC